MPKKAAYNAFRHNPELEFEHYLALKLGRTIYELRTQMSHAEFVRWSVYFQKEAQERELEIELAKAGGRSG